MARTLYATFDGKVLRPEEELDLPADTRVRVTIEEPGDPETSGLISRRGAGEPYSFIKTALSLNLQGPPDWAEKLDEYLYGGRELPE